MPMYIYDNIWVNLLTVRNVSDKSCGRNQNISCSIMFPKNLAFCEIMWQKYGKAIQGTDDNMAHVCNMLDN